MCTWLISPWKLYTDILCDSCSFVAEPTFPARICSSSLLLYFLVACPIVLFGLLLISLLCLYQKARKLSRESRSTQKEKALWVGMKGAEGWITGRKEDEEEEEEHHWILRAGFELDWLGCERILILSLTVSGALGMSFEAHSKHSVSI